MTSFLVLFACSIPYSSDVAMSISTHYIQNIKYNASQRSLKSTTLDKNNFDILLMIIQLQYNIL